MESLSAVISVDFYGSGFECSCGVLKKRVVGRGFLMVNLWWKRGESWCVDARYLGLKNFPRIRELFLEIPVLGIGLVW